MRVGFKVADSSQSLLECVVHQFLLPDPDRAKKVSLRKPHQPLQAY